MILKLPENLHGKELLQYIWKEKALLTKQKKAGIAFGGDFGSGITEKSAYLHQEKAIKVASDSDGKAIIANNLANLCLWFDYQQDIIIPDAFKKTLSDNGYFFSLKDHGRYTTDIIGETMEVTMQTFMPSELGIVTRSMELCTGPVFKTRITENTGGLIYHQYREGLIKNHSIGYRPLRYELAMADPDFENEHKLWKQWIGRVINREEAEKVGYMWVNFELALIENSAVVQGANPQTPVISIEEEKTDTPAAESGTGVMDAKAVTDTEAKKAFSHYTIF